jgi:hypothetical protein
MTLTDSGTRIFPASFFRSVGKRQTMKQALYLRFQFSRMTDTVPGTLTGRPWFR